MYYVRTTEIASSPRSAGRAIWNAPALPTASQPTGKAAPPIATPTTAADPTHWTRRTAPDKGEQG